MKREMIVYRTGAGAPKGSPVQGELSKIYLIFD